LIKGEGRGALQNLDVPGYGEIPVPKVPYLFSETKVEFQPILSMAGEDNREVLSDTSDLVGKSSTNCKPPAF
jgi:hypothetical protein